MKTKQLLAIATVAAALLVPATARPDEASADALARAEAACDAHDWPEALAWFEVAAESGDRGAQKIAGLMHLYGERMYAGVERNLGRAKAWLYRAETQGSTDAQDMLARLERDPSLDPARLVAALADERRPR
jgi:TPR repeat protein